MRKSIQKLLSWLLTFSLGLSIIPAFDVKAMAANVMESIDVSSGMLETETSVTELERFNQESTAKRLGLTAQYVDVGMSAHGSWNDLASELDAASYSDKYNSMSEDWKENILLLICSGYTSSQAYGAVVAADVLGISVAELAKAKVREIESTNNPERSVDSTEEVTRDEAIYKASIKMGVSYSLLQDYLSDAEEDCETLISRYNTAYADVYNITVPDAAVSSTSNGTQFYTPDKVLDNMYSYEDNGNFSINLNSGSYTYTETDLSIPGVNGLDLNIVRRYQSQNSNTHTVHGSINSNLTHSTHIKVGYKTFVKVGEDAYGRDVLNLISNLSDYGFRDPDYQDDHAFFNNSGISQEGGRYVKSYSVTNYLAAAALKDSCEEFWEDAYRTSTPNTTVRILFRPFIESIGNNLADDTTNVSAEYAYYPKNYGLGYGWSLGFSSIETYKSGGSSSTKQRLITRTGEKYEVDFSASGSHLVDYPRTDLVLSRTTSSTYSGASYKLAYADGTNEFFDGNGRLIAIVDRFGNKITLAHTDTNSDGYIDTISIVDTLGNNILYKNSMQTVAATISHGGVSYTYNRKWTLSLNSQVLKTYYVRVDSASGMHYLVAVQDALGDYTFYSHRNVNYDFNCFVTTASTNDGVRVSSILERVTYPTGLIKMVSSPTRNGIERLGETGYTQYTETEEYTEYYLNGYAGIYGCNRRYQYGDYSALDAPRTSSGNTDTTKASNRYITTAYELHQKTEGNATEEWYSVRTLYSFDSTTHSTVEEARSEYEFLQYEDLGEPSHGEFDLDAATANIDYTAKLVQKKIYEYDTYKNPTKITTALYNRGDSTAPMSYVEQYTCDAKGNVLTETQPNGLVITNTYSSSYSIPLTTTYSPSTGTTILSTNTLTTDEKSIATNVLKSNGVVVGKTTYTYESGTGRIATQKQYLNESTYLETTYTYNSSHAAPTKVVYKDIRNADGTLVTATSGQSSGELAVKYEYNDREDVTKETDARGYSTTIQYDSVGRITKVTNPDSSYATYTYDVDANTVVHRDERGTSLRYEYDPFDNLTGVYDVAGSRYLSKTTYGCYGWPLEETRYNSSSSGSVTAYRYDASGRPLVVDVENLSGTLIASTTYAYTYVNDLFKTTKTVVGDVSAPSIVTTSYVDEMGNTTKTGRVLSGTEYVDTYTYDKVGNMIAQCTAYSANRGKSYTYQCTYDANGNMLTQKNSLGNTTTYTYDWLGNCLTVKDPMGNTSINTYDKLGRVIKMEQPFSGTYYAVTKLYYDGNGNVISEKHQNNAPGATATWTQVDYAYNNRNLLSRVTQYRDGKGTETTYTYDAGGNILTKTISETPKGEVYSLSVDTDIIYSLGDEDNIAAPNASGDDELEDLVSVTYTYTYDRFGNQLTEKNPLNKTETYTYDLAGNVLTKKDRNGVTTTYTYDVLNRLLTATAGSLQLQNVYAKNGLKLSESSGTTVNYTYDSLGRMLTKQLASGGTTYTHTYAYDIGDNCTSYTLKSGSTTRLSNTYGYDVMSRMTSVTNSSKTTTYSYDANGRRTGVNYGNYTYATYSYNKANLLTSLIYYDNKDVETLECSYTYALNGNQLTKTEDGRVTTYTYDAYGQLTKEQIRASAGGAVTQTYSYVYNPFGNRISMTASGAEAYTKSYTYNDANQLLKETKTASGTTSSTTYTYDNNGNQLTKNTGSTATSVTNTYNAFNQLTASSVGGTSTAHTYTPDGLRLTKGNLTYLYDRGNLVLEMQGSSVKSSYVYGVGLVSGAISGYSGQTYFIHNGHGDIVQLQNSSRTVVKEYTYDAFGNEEDPVSTDANPFRYAGEYYDTNTGTYYLRARYYDPVIGRFTQEDPHWTINNMIYEELDNASKESIIDNECDGFLLSENILAPEGYNALFFNKKIISNVHILQPPKIYAIIQSSNLYAYTSNNPIHYVDSTGESLTVALGVTASVVKTVAYTVGVGAVVKATISYFKEHTKNASKKNWDKHTKKRAGATSKAQKKSSWTSRSNKRNK